MARANKGFSAAEDVRLFGKTGLTLEIYNKAGDLIHPKDANDNAIEWLADQDLWRIAQGTIAQGNYSYAVFQTDSDNVRRIVRHGNLTIYPGAVKLTADEQELEMIEAVLTGDDADVSAIKFPDGREIVYANREAMRLQANRLRERIAVKQRGSLMGIRGAV